MIGVSATVVKACFVFFTECSILVFTVFVHFSASSFDITTLSLLFRHSHIILFIRGALPRYQTYSTISWHLVSVGLYSTPTIINQLMRVACPSDNTFNEFLT